MALWFPSNCCNSSCWFANVPLLKSLPKVKSDTNKGRQVKQTVQSFLHNTLEGTFISPALLSSLLIWPLQVSCFHTEGSWLDGWPFLCVHLSEDTTKYICSLSFSFLLLSCCSAGGTSSCESVSVHSHTVSRVTYRACVCDSYWTAVSYSRQRHQCLDSVAPQIMSSPCTSPHAAPDRWDWVCERGQQDEIEILGPLHPWVVLVMDKRVNGRDCRAATRVLVPVCTVLCISPLWWM